MGYVLSLITLGGLLWYRSVPPLEFHLCSSEENVSVWGERRHLTHHTHKREQGFAACGERGSPQASEKTRAKLCPLSCLPRWSRLYRCKDIHSVNRLAPAVECPVGKNGLKQTLPGFELCFQSCFQREQRTEPIHSPSHICSPVSVLPPFPSTLPQDFLTHQWVSTTSKIPQNSWW